MSGARRSGRIGIRRRKTRQVWFGKVAVGGEASISIQSMCTFPPAAAAEAAAQIGSLRDAGCEIVRVSVRNEEDVACLPRLLEASAIPVVADVHFDHRLAVKSVGAGVHGLRINPGNIGGEEKVREVFRAASDGNIPVRIGVNSGSLEKGLRALYDDDPARALCESALGSLAVSERAGFSNLVFSLKSSDPIVTVQANRLFSASSDHPLHIGVTEAGPPLTGTATSVVALTILLMEGIGDTIRVSLSGDPVREVIVAAAVLSSLGLREDIPRIIACPTCGRSHIDVAAIASALERVLPAAGTDLRVAVMGCEVNGPGEAAEADIGIAGTGRGAVLFKKGRIERKIDGDPLEALLEEIRKLGDR